jgi:hypothetical protein
VGGAAGGAPNRHYKVTCSSGSGSGTDVKPLPVPLLDLSLGSKADPKLAASLASDHHPSYALLNEAHDLEFSSQGAVALEKASGGAEKQRQKSRSVPGVGRVTANRSAVDSLLKYNGDDLMGDPMAASSAIADLDSS